jgi:C-terminal processing protease CtpA/Prc
MPSTEIELSARSPSSSKPFKTTVTALTFDERLAPRKTEIEATRGSEPVFEMKSLDAATAYLRMPSWALYNSKWDWKRFLGETFDELSRKNTPNLIIDIRENEGGLDVGDEIIARLISQELTVPSSQRYVRYRKAPADLVPYLDTWDPSFKDWGADAVEDRDGFFKLARDDNKMSKTIGPSGSRFSGRVFLLVGATNSSATFEFARLMKQHKLATLVGQPTGGNQRGINGGAFFFLRLPKSKIEVDLPLIATFPPNAPDAGIEPDVRVIPSVKDIAAGRDSELEKALELIRKTR